MRLFQNSSLYPSYVPQLTALAGPGASFDGHRRALLKDLYGSLHLLEPVLNADPSAFLANGHDNTSQHAWATERGMPSKVTLDDILLAQIEEHRTEVFYNLDPMTFPGRFAQRLPGTVKAKIAWRAAPSGSTDFRGYDCMVCNFPSILRSYESSGLRTADLWPAFDTRLMPYAENTDRPIDVAFVGSFSRHHLQRTSILKAVAALSPQFNVALHLEVSRFTRLAEYALWRFGVPERYKRPAQVQRIAKGPIFGRDLYRMLSRSKIVINASIDMAGKERGNIRCFEALGAGALLLTDNGLYPPGMVDAETISIYRQPEEIAPTVQALLADPARISDIAARGARMIQSRYSKAAQWQAFERIVAGQSQHTAGVHHPPGVPA
jgi:hypothetical protein